MAAPPRLLLLALRASLIAGVPGDCFASAVMGDRVFVVFATPEEISAMVGRRC